MISVNKIKSLLEGYNFIAIDMKSINNFPEIVESFISKKEGNYNAWAKVNDLSILEATAKYLLFSKTNTGDIWMNHNTSETMLTDKYELGKTVLMIELKDILEDNVKGKKKKLVL